MKKFLFFCMSVGFQCSQAMHVGPDTKVVAKRRSQSIIGQLSDAFSKLKLSKTKPTRSASVGDETVVLIPTPELIEAVKARLDTSGPKQFCVSIGRIFTNSGGLENLVEKYALTPELLGLVLRECNVKVNMQDEHGKAPLHFAYHYGQIDVLKTLLYAGATVNIKSKALKTPIHILPMNVNIEILQELLCWGADPTSVNIDELNIGMKAYLKLKDGVILRGQDFIPKIQRAKECREFAKTTLNSSLLPVLADLILAYGIFGE